MKIKAMLFVFTMLTLSIPNIAFSDGPVAVSSPSVSAVSIAAQPAQIALPSAPAHALVAVSEPAAPPQWAQDLVTFVESLPMVGPIVAKVLVYLGILVSIMTVIVTMLTGILGTLSGISNYAGFTAIVAALTAFQNGPIMYWLKFFSAFNAKKPDPK